jgi:hypothetical protein
MCLSRIDEYPGNPTEGYKVFKKGIQGLYSPLFHVSESFPVGEWITDEYAEILRDDFNYPYLSGFHFFFGRKDAEDYLEPNEVIRKIKVKYVTATGINHSINDTVGVAVGVARMMYIEEDEDVE